MPVLLRVVLAKSGPAADAFGVGHIFAAIASTKLPPLPFRRNRSAISGVGSQPMHLSAVGVGNDPHSLTAVRRTNG
jgi:hypothetical protein